LPTTPRHRREGRHRCGSGVEADLFAQPLSHHPNEAPQQISPNYRMEERVPLPLLSPKQQVEGEGPKAPAGGDGIWPPAA
jgi:hypothetical protein